MRIKENATILPVSLPRSARCRDEMHDKDGLCRVVGDYKL